MSPRNVEWAKTKLGEFRDALTMIEDIRSHRQSYSVAGHELDAAYELAHRLFPVAAELIESLLPGQLDRTLSLKQHGVVAQYIDLADQAVGAADAAEELEENWPAEVNPTLDTSRIHPWVWDPAKDLWEIGRYKEALHTSAITVNARLQDKLGRNDLEFTPLARNAFSTKEPREEQPRLRMNLPDGWGDEEWSDLHSGAANLGEAVFRLWRNLPSHKDYEIDEQPATEALAAMSAFARMVDEAEVVLSVANETEPSG